ncbi:MAG: O-antigen ligase family protein [Lentisphaerae bacterium]|nr:O-antigen ligase family protein [Lentisphaerota bacterium]
MNITSLRYSLLPATLILMVLLLLAAAGAGIYGWSLAGAALLLALTTLLVHGPVAQADPAAPLPPRWQRIEWVYLAALSFLLLMLIPLPLSLTAMSGGERYDQNMIVATRLQQAAALDALDPPALLFSLTRNRAGTMRVLAICIGAFSCVLVGSRLSMSGRRFLLRGLILGGALIAGAGILSLTSFPQGDTLWWWITIPHILPGPAACFANQNHFGGFAALLCPAALVAAAYDISRRRWLAAILMSLCALTMAAAVPLSESRGGVVAIVGSILLLPILLYRMGHRRIGLWLLLPLLAIVLTLSIAVLPRVSDSMQTLLRPTQTASLQSRMQVWREALRIWPHYPILGSGPNSFHTTYPIYRHSSASGQRTHAENLYVETLVDSGTIGCLLVLWALAAGLAGLRRSRRVPSTDPFLFFAATGALIVAAIHALVDFAPYVPLYSLTLGALIGVALPPPSSRRPVAAYAAVGLSVVLCFWAPAMEKRDSIYHLYKSDMASLSRALVWAPSSQHAWLHAGRRLTKQYPPPIQRLGERFMTQSMVYDPQNYRHWIKLGDLRLKLNDHDGAREAYERAHALRSWVGMPTRLKEGT